MAIWQYKSVQNTLYVCIKQDQVTIFIPYENRTMYHREDHNERY